MSQQRARPLRRELIRLQDSRRWTPTPPAGAAIVVDTSQAGRPLVQSEVQYTFDSSALPARRMQGASGRRRVELHGGCRPGLCRSRRSVAACVDYTTAYSRTSNTWTAARR